MGMIARSDGELVEASLRGEHEAFGHLVARYQDVVCAVSYSSTGDRGLSEDVAQETFIAAWSQLDRLRDTVRLRPWLCGIARNLARNARKRTWREQVSEIGEVAADANPFDDAARGEVEQVVRAALAKVPAKYREVLVLHYRENQSIREIAETLGTSEPAIMQRLTRGRRHLADGVTALVERSLRGERSGEHKRRDLVAAVLASIAALAIPSRVDASPTKGSTMLKYALAGSAVVAAGSAAYLVHTHRAEPAPVAARAPAALHYGTGRLGLTHAPTLGPTAAPRLIASRSLAEADLGLLPADAEAVLGINFAQVRESALWKRYAAPLLAHVDGIREFETLCGFDPLASLGSLAVGLKGLNSNNGLSGAIVIHGFEKAKALTCFDKHGLPDAERDGSKIAIDGDVVLMTDREGHHTAFTFIDNTTALIVIGPEAATREGVERIAGGDSGLRTSTTYGSTLQYINTDDSLWLMASGTSPLIAEINKALAPITPVQLGASYLAMHVSDSLAVDVGVHLGSPETVATLVAAIQAQMSSPAALLATQLCDQLDVTADGSDLIVSLAISGDQLQQLHTSLSGTVSFTDE